MPRKRKAPEEESGGVKIGTKRKREHAKKKKQVESQEPDQVKKKKSRTSNNKKTKITEETSDLPTPPLPVEILLSIFEYLPTIRDIARASIVSHSWNDASVSDTLWKKHLLQIFPQVKPCPTIISAKEQLRGLGSCGGCGKFTYGAKFKKTKRFTYLSDSPSVPYLLCEACAKKDNIITKTTAKKEYRLTDSEIDDNLPIYFAPSPYYKTTSIMYRIPRPAAQALAIRKFGSLEALEEKKAEQSLRAVQRKEAGEHRRQERREKLETALKARGLELRGDSRLCTTYIKSGKGKRKEIVNIMEEMAFYFNDTDYPDILEDIKDCYRDNMEPWDSVKISEEAKDKALHRWVKEAMRDDSFDMEEVPPSLHTRVITLKNNRLQNVNSCGDSCWISAYL